MLPTGFLHFIEIDCLLKSPILALLRACLVSVFKHSFLCLNTENGGPGLKFFYLVTVFTFCIQIQLLYT